MSRNVRKRNFWHVSEMKTQISLRIREVWLASSLSAWTNFASLATQNVPSGFRSDSAYAQAALNLHWVQMSEGTFP